MRWQQMWKQLKIIQLWIQKYQLQQHVASWAWLNPQVRHPLLLCLLPLVYVTPQGHLTQRAGLVKSAKKVG